MSILMNYYNELLNLKAPPLLWMVEKEEGRLGENYKEIGYVIWVLSFIYYLVNVLNLFTNTAGSVLSILR